LECCAYLVPVLHSKVGNCQLKTRSEFDKILLDHAEITGAQVFQSTKVMSLDFSGERPVSAHWQGTHGSSSQSGVITFDYLVDASGRTGLMSTRYLKNRRFNASLKNVAMWAYWKNADVYARGTAAEGAPYFEALSGMVVLRPITESAFNLSKDESGWAWFIPLREGLTSVGIVRDRTAFKQAVRSQGLGCRVSQSFTPSPTTPLTGFWDASPTSSSAESSSHRDSSTDPASCGTPPSSLSSSTVPFSPGGSWSALVGAEQRYLKVLDLAPGVKRLLGSESVMLRGELESDTVRTASDYSYSASSYAGENFRVVGDAAGMFFYSNAKLHIKFSTFRWY
jgi:hypothetical protein